MCVHDTYLLLLPPNLHIHLADFFEAAALYNTFLGRIGTSDERFRSSSNSCPESVELRPCVAYTFLGTVLCGTCVLGRALIMNT